MSAWRSIFATVGLAFGLTAMPTDAQQSEPLRIGILSDISGPGAVLAIKMAVEDFGDSVLGRKIQVLSADHQNKADIAVDLARQWIDTQHVAMLGDLMNSSAAIAIVALAKDKKRIAIVNGASRAP